MRIFPLGLSLLLACGEGIDDVGIAGLEPPGEAEASSPSDPAEGPRLIMLVSIDTTRADALHCYADTDHWAAHMVSRVQSQMSAVDLRDLIQRFPRASTPVMCGLAEQGVRFQWGLSHAPTTLSSHTSMFSGREPHRHRVVRNGYPVPDDIPLLAERFAGAGWDRIAVVGASALEAKMGLERGFRSYLDPGPQPPGGTQFLAADEIGRRVLSEVDSRPDPSQDLFLFVHYYDPHMPWFDERIPQAFAPEAFRNAMVDPDYSGPVDGSMRSIGYLTEAHRQGALTFADARQARALYLSQVSWVDSELGLLLDGLESRGLLKDSLVVLTSDHGEALDDSEGHPYTHGPRVDLSTIHVPLIFHGSGSMRLTEEPVVVEQKVRLMDLASTLLSVAGLGEVMGDGEDLSGLWQGASWSDPPHMAEATRPMDLESKTRWNNLPLSQAVVQDGLVFQKYPVSVDGQMRSAHGLFLLAPGQPQAPIRDARGVVSDVGLQRMESLRSTLLQWNQTAPAHREAEYDAETAAALQALGYLESSD